MLAETDRRRPQSTARILGIPIYRMLAPFPTVLFIAAFVTDVIYSRTAYLQWQYFSVWMIAAGLFVGGFAILAALIDHFSDRRLRSLAPARWHMVLLIVIWILELINAFVHSRDGWTAVVPDGLIISAVATVLVLVGGWLGLSLTYRHGVGVEA